MNVILAKSSLLYIYIHELISFFLISHKTDTKHKHIYTYANPIEWDTDSTLIYKSDVKRRNTSRPPRSVYHTK